MVRSMDVYQNYLVLRANLRLYSINIDTREIIKISTDMRDFDIIDGYIIYGDSDGKTYKVDFLGNPLDM